MQVDPLALRLGQLDKRLDLWIDVDAAVGDLSALHAGSRRVAGHDDLVIELGDEVIFKLVIDDPDWLRQLGEYRQIFKERLKEAKSLVKTADQKNIIELIEYEYKKYIEFKDRVIAHYKADERDIGAHLLFPSREAAERETVYILKGNGGKPHNK